MSLGITDSKHYKNIANEIREKNPRVSGLLKPPEMAEAINDIDGRDLVSFAPVYVTPKIEAFSVYPENLDFFSEVHVAKIPYSQSLNNKNGYTVKIGEGD